MSKLSLSKENRKIIFLDITNTKFLKRISLDVYALIIFNIIMYLIFAEIDCLELIYKFSQEYQDYELDEIVPLFFTIAVSLFLFSLRRLSELKKSFEITKEMSIKDHLTGLYNRRVIEDFYEIEKNRINRSESNLSLLIIDIDNFKKINDIFGHNTGDFVLKEFSKILRKSTRNIDIIARWGGEEFLILCPHTKACDNDIIGNRILSDVRSFSFTDVKSLSASIGIVNIKKDEDFKDAIKRADDLLYKAKHSGKDCFMKE